MSGGPLPVVSYLKMPEGRNPYLEGHKCDQCGAVFLGERRHCSKCGARDSMTKIQLSNRGTLHSYSIVYRSFPGVDVPYISAIVDLEGGGTVKGNLMGVDADIEKPLFNLPVEVVYDDALGRKDADGNSYLSYFFKPA